VAWLYLSPHLDDAVFSCGGLIWEQASRRDEVQVWTICAGDPPPLPLSAYAQGLHDRWGTGQGGAAPRRAEDVLACRRLGARYRHFSIPDAIYRRNPEDGKPLYTSDEDLFRALPASEYGLVEQLADQLKELLPPECQLVCPLALGNHVDHQLVRAAVESTGLPLWYYADLPYVLRAGGPPDDLVAGIQACTFQVTGFGLDAWVESAAAYGSQIGTFWPGVVAMQAELRAYCHAMGGVRLWKQK